MRSPATRASSSGCCSTRSRGCRSPTGGALPAALDDADRPGAVHGVRRARRRGAGCAPTWSRAASGCASRRAGGRPRRSSPRCGAIVPEALASRRPALGGRGRRGDRALPLVARPALPRLAVRAASQPLRGEPAGATSTSTALVTPDERGLPVVTVIDGASHALAFARQRARHAIRSARRRRVRSDRQPAQSSTPSTGSTPRRSLPPRSSLSSLSEPTLNMFPAGLSGSAVGVRAAIEDHLYLNYQRNSRTCWRFQQEHTRLPECARMFPGGRAKESAGRASRNSQPIEQIPGVIPGDPVHPIDL